MAATASLAARHEQPPSSAVRPGARRLDGQRAADAGRIAELTQQLVEARHMQAQTASQVRLQWFMAPALVERVLAPALVVRVLMARAGRASYHQPCMLLP